MKDINSTIAKNISDLRNAKGLTQAELAEGLNYSDKAVSKWERAESIPNIATLEDIAVFFNVPIEYLLRDHTTEENADIASALEYDPSRIHTNRKIITMMAIVSVWLIATFIYVVLHSLPESMGLEWLIFLYAVPVSLIVWLVFNSIWFSSRLNFLIISLLMWTALAVIYVSLRVAGLNLWYVFFLGTPGQILILLWAGIKIPDKYNIKKIYDRRKNK